MKRPPSPLRLTGKRPGLTIRQRSGGFTLAEFLVAIGACTTMLTALVLGAVALQRSYSASDQYAKAQNSQLRVMDYLTRDLRRASLVYNNTADPSQISVQVPDYYDTYDAKGNPTLASNPRDPTITTGSPVSGPNPLTITYYRDTTTLSLMRQVKWTADGVAKQSDTVIADGVQNFETSFANYGSIVQATITFQPIFEKNKLAMAREGTTLRAAVTLRDAPL